MFMTKKEKLAKREALSKEYRETVKKSKRNRSNEGRKIFLELQNESGTAS